jgi:hypothetical protein
MSSDVCIISIGCIFFLFVTVIFITGYIGTYESQVKGSGWLLVKGNSTALARWKVGRDECDLRLLLGG